MRSLKLKTDEEVFDAMYGAENLNDEDFKVFMTEAMIRLMGVAFE
jgi:hypothetical protein